MLEAAASRDAFLQAIVDLATRTRGDCPSVLARVFGELSGVWATLQSEREWAGGSAEIQCGARELLWEGGHSAATRHLAAAQKTKARLDERTRRLLRSQLRQARRALSGAVWEQRRQELLAFFTQLDSGRGARELLDSVEGAGQRASVPRASVWNSVKRAVWR